MAKSNRQFLVDTKVGGFARETITCINIGYTWFGLEWELTNDRVGYK